MFCPQCGNQMEVGARFCQGCGYSMDGKSSPSVTRKSPWLALILSLIIVGLGQFYNGQISKGFLMLGLGIVTGIFSMSIGWFVVSVWSAYDAYTYAKNR